MSSADVVSSPPETESPAIDGKFRIRISRDGCEVFLDELSPPVSGGKPVTPSLILAKLKKLKLQCTVDSAAIDRALAQVSAGPPPVAGGALVIARGRPAREGQDGVLEWFVEASTEGQLRVVRPQQPVARYRPATAGEPGTDVFGKKIRARDGVDQVTSTGAGISVVVNGENKEFIAGQYGQVQFKSGCVSIDPCTVVSDDKLTVTVSLFPLKGEALTLPHILETLAALGVRYGIDEHGLHDALARLNHARQPQVGVVVARGVAAVDEQDPAVTWIIPQSTIQTGMAVALGGDPLLKIALSSVAPRNGINVLGEEIAARRTRTPLPEAGPGVEVTEQDGVRAYYAKHYGRIVLEGSALSVAIPLYTDDDRMKVTMDLYKASSAPGQRRCSESDIVEALKAAGVVFGLQSDIIGQSLSQLHASNALLLRRVVVAKGRPAVDGVDESLDLVNNVNSGKLLANGRIDFHDHNYPLNVTYGTVVARRIDAKPAQEGCDVYGSRIVGAAPKALELTFDGVEQRADGSLVASRDGALLVGNGTLAVTELLIVGSDVGAATGNIDAKLAVQVKGYVSAGYRVASSADVVVKDNIEQAQVSAGGGLVVHGGIRGADSQVEAQSRIQAAFIELASVRCIGEVVVAKGIVNADVRAGSSVRISDPSKGAIMGGQIRARSDISAAILGSAACVKTRLELELPPEPVEQLAELRSKIDKNKENLAALEALCSECAMAGGEAAQEKCRRICNTVDAMREELATLKQQRDDLIQQIVALKTARIRALRRVYPGVQVRLFGVVLNVEKELGPGEFFLKGDKVAFEPR